MELGKKRGIYKTLYARIKGAPDQYAECYFLILDAGNDETVLTILEEEYQNMMRKDYTDFFCLLYLKSEQFKRFGEHKTLEAVNMIVAKINSQNNIYFHFAKMELEAWFLAEPGVFSLINSLLTIKYIQEKLGKDLDNMDPEKEISGAAYLIKKIHKLGSLQYRKHEDEIHRIVSRLDWEKLCIEARRNGKISFFFKFLDKLDSVIRQPS